MFLASIFFLQISANADAILDENIENIDRQGACFESLVYDCKIDYTTNETQYLDDIPEYITKK